MRGLVARVVLATFSRLWMLSTIRTRMLSSRSLHPLSSRFRATDKSSRSSKPHLKAALIPLYLSRGRRKKLVDRSENDCLRWAGNRKPLGQGKFLAVLLYSLKCLGAIFETEISSVMTRLRSGHPRQNCPDVCLHVYMLGLDPDVLQIPLTPHTPGGAAPTEVTPPWLGP